MGTLREDQHTFFIIALSLLLKKEMFQTEFVENITTHILC